MSEFRFEFHLLSSAVSRFSHRERVHFLIDHGQNCKRLFKTANINTIFSELSKFYSTFSRHKYVRTWSPKLFVRYFGQLKSVETWLKAPCDEFHHEHLPLSLLFLLQLFSSLPLLRRRWQRLPSVLSLFPSRSLSVADYIHFFRWFYQCILEECDSGIFSAGYFFPIRHPENSITQLSAKAPRLSGYFGSW